MKSIYSVRRSLFFGSGLTMMKRVLRPKNGTKLMPFKANCVFSISVVILSLLFCPCVFFHIINCMCFCLLPSVGAE